MIEKLVTRRISVPDSRVAELKEEIGRIYEPGSWADGWTYRAFQQKWGFSVEEATLLVGRPVTTTHWKDPD